VVVEEIRRRNKKRKKAIKLCTKRKVLDESVLLVEKEADESVLLVEKEADESVLLVEKEANAPILKIESSMIQEVTYALSLDITSDALSSTVGNLISEAACNAAMRKYSPLSGSGGLLGIGGGVIVGVGGGTVDYDERYKKAWAYGKEPSSLVRDLITEGILTPHPCSNDDPPTVLSIGEGQGRNIVYLATHGYRGVGVDRSEIGNKKAFLLAQQNGLTGLTISILGTVILTLILTLGLISTLTADLEEFRPAQNSYEAIINIFTVSP